MQTISVVENVIPACQLSTIDRFILGPSVGNWEFIWPTTTLSNGANKKNMENYKKKYGNLLQPSTGNSEDKHGEIKK
jgi:hypothetical protein